MRALLLAASLGLASAASAQGAEHLIGRPYAGLPGGWAEVGGSVMGDLPDDEHTYILSAFRRLGDADGLVLYTRVDQMLNGRHPIETVLAALEMDDVRDGETLAWFECTLLDDPYSARVVAVVGEAVFDEQAVVHRFGAVRLAWRLDRAAVRFVPLDPALVTCPDVSPVD